MARLAYFMRRIGESIKLEGVGFTARKVTREAVDRINPPWQCVFWMPIAEFEAPPSDDRVSLRVMSEFSGGIVQADLESRLDASTIAVFRSRVKNGCHLCVLLKGQAIAGTLFLVFGRSHCFQHLVLTDQDVVIFDARIDPEFRGQGLYHLFLQLTLAALKGPAIERVYVATSEHNEPSVRALRRAGFRYLMRYKILGGLYKYDVRPF